MKTLGIEDRLALQDLIADYAWALDTGDVEGLVACFTPDATMVEEVFEDADVWVGHDGIRALADHYRNAPGFPGRQHHVTQTQYRPQADGSVQMRSFAVVTECDGEPPYALRFAGWYDDVAVQLDAKWLFRQRTIRLWDGEVLKNFPGRGQWVPRKRPPSLIIRRQAPGA